MNTIRRKLIIATGLAVVGAYAAWPFLQHLAHRATRQMSWVGGPLPGRSRENSPSIEVESGTTLCYRTLWSDFRFPLPQMMRVARVELAAGKLDTYQGRVYLTNDGTQIMDLPAYARLMWKHGFAVDGPLGSSFSASSPDGGFVAVESTDHGCKIGFAYFEDN